MTAQHSKAAATLEGCAQQLARASVSWSCIGMPLQLRPGRTGAASCAPHGAKRSTRSPRAGALRRQLNRTTLSCPASWRAQDSSCRCTAQKEGRCQARRAAEAHQREGSNRPAQAASKKGAETKKHLWCMRWGRGRACRGGLRLRLPVARCQRGLLAPRDRPAGPAPSIRRQAR